MWNKVIQRADLPCLDVLKVHLLSDHASAAQVLRQYSILRLTIDSGEDCGLVQASSWGKCFSRTGAHVTSSSIRELLEASGFY